MKKEFYRVGINITPTYCNQITYTVAIDEPIEEFLKRQSNSYQRTSLVYCIPCTEEEYNFYKKYNPTAGSYVIQKEKVK